MLEKCSFCGLGFEPVWDVRLASCKHGYHEWCCRFHFENSTKCVEEGCNEEMHEGWWSAVGLVKPGTSACVLSTPRAIKLLPDSPLGSLYFPIYIVHNFRSILMDTWTKKPLRYSKVCIFFLPCHTEMV